MKHHYIVIVVSITMLTLLISIFTLRVQAAEDHESFSVYTEKVSKEVEDYVKSIASVHVSGLYDMYYYNPSVEGFDISLDSEVWIGKGFYKYHISSNGQLYHDNVAFFPIIQEGKIVCFITAMWNEQAGMWGSDCNIDIAPMIRGSELEEGISVFDSYGNEFYVSQGAYKLVARAVPLCYTGAVEPKEAMAVDKRSDNEIDPLILELSKNFNAAVAELQAPVYQAETEGIDAISLSPVSVSESYEQYDSEASSEETSGALRTGPNGFSINQTDYKVFNTDYCLVLQKDYTGTVRGLCWAATCATTIRYRTGNHTLESWQLADAYNVDYDAGVLPSKAKTVLHDYGETQYDVRWYNGAISQTEVRHNINNQYPIYMDAGYYTSPVTGVFHANTIVGYQVINGTMTLRSWDSALNSGNGAFRTTTYAGSTGTYYYMNGHNMYWTRSVLIKLS